MEKHAQNYFYHYTNVGSLAMILKNRNIRFSPLPVLDDVEEKKNQDRQVFGRWVFVSSWTKNAVESIPMWTMYAQKTEGVRIRLPAYPFRNYKLTSNDFDEIRANARRPLIMTEDLDIVIPPDKLVNADYFLLNKRQQEILFEVRYTDDRNKLYPRVINQEGRDLTVTLSVLGQHKNTYWSFQEEWRYILYFMPVSVSDISTKPLHHTLMKVFACMDLPFDYYYLTLDDEKFEDMEITLGPQISDANRIIVNLLVEKFNPTAQIQESALRGKIR
jgi:hypothetical protein